jgi:hypothetical protein
LEFIIESNDIREKDPYLEMAALPFLDGGSNGEAKEFLRDCIIIVGSLVIGWIPTRNSL